MDGNRRVESETTDVAFDEALHRPPREGAGAKPVSAAAAGRCRGSEQRAQWVVPNMGGIEPPLQSFDRLRV